MYTSDEKLTANIPVIVYKRFEKLQQQIARCQRMTERLGEPRCLARNRALLAQAKRHLRNTMLRNIRQANWSWEQRCEVFYVQTPARTTVPSFTDSMLVQLGDPAASIHIRGDADKLPPDERLDRLIAACGVKLVIVDDFQHLLNIDTEKQKRAVSDWLKVRIKKTRVPFMIVGITGKVTEVLKFNPQLSRLFALSKVLDPFSLSRDQPAEWNNAEAENFAEFDYFIRCAQFLYFSLTHH